MTWSKQTILESLGLPLLNYKAYDKKKGYIDKGEIDPRSLGGLALISESHFDKKGHLEKLDLRYWIVHPDGRYEKRHLAELETDINKKSVGIKSLSILGYEVDASNVEFAIEAIRRIHVSLRDPGHELPNVAKIFKDTMLEQTMGETLPLPGFNLDHRIYFTPTVNFNLKSSNSQKAEITLPREVFRPLSGIRTNTFDLEHSFIGRRDKKLSSRVFLPKIRKHFEIVSRFKKVGAKKKWRHLTLTQNLMDMASPTNANDKKRLLSQAKWKPSYSTTAELKMVTLSKLELLGQNTLHDFKKAMGTLGVLNRTHTDMMRDGRDYPYMADHMTTYGLIDLIPSTSEPPSKEGRLVVTSIGGNNLEEHYPGVGGDIGGNCKVAEMQYVDKKTGAIKKHGAILDFGSWIIKKKSEWTAAHPDVVEKLEYCKDIFITHHHLDHIDGLLPYITRKLLTKDHTVHMTAEVYEMLDKKLIKLGIKKHDPRRPNINILEGTGVVNIKDEKGIDRLSVMYGVDAVPHSAKDTPFIAYGRNGNEILGSYQYLGDMRYDEEWFTLHDSAFWDPVKVMKEACPELHEHMRQKNLKDPELYEKARTYLQSLRAHTKGGKYITKKQVRKTVENWHFIPAVSELDGTSIKYDGRGTSESEVVDNLTFLLDEVFHDKHAGVAIIGTNDGRRESLLSVGNLSRRLMTAMGSAVEDLFAIGNKHGINPYRLERPKASQKFLGYIKQCNLHPDHVPNVPSSDYTGIKNFLKHDAEKRGTDPTKFIGRSSKTVKGWFKDTKPGRIMAIMSGSQGNEVEQESTTYKIADGRSLLDADPDKVPNALPANLKDWVIVFSQGAIPGNEKDQKNLIRKISERGATVVESVGDNIYIHNPKKLKSRILDAFIERGNIDPDNIQSSIEGNKLFIKNFSIHASGHGRKEDARLWMRNKLISKMIGIHHTDDQEAVRAGFNLIEEEGRHHAGGIFKNGKEIHITNDHAREIGTIQQSLILTKETMEPGKQFDKRLEAQRVIIDGPDSPHETMGLRSTGGGAMKAHFGTESIDETRRHTENSAQKNRKKRDLVSVAPRQYRSPRAFPVGQWNPDFSFNLPS